MLITTLGLIAAAMTSLSYLPQVRKALPERSTEDLSLKTLIILAIGLVLWILYGVVRKDWVVVVANVVGCSLVLTLIAFKVRDKRLVSIALPRDE